jgi:hypothetical protein
LKNNNFILSITVFLPLFIIFAFCRKQEAQWGGTIEEVGGVTVVKNPKEPMYGEEVFSLEAELTIGEANGPKEYMFSSLRYLTVDDRGYIYALDYKEKHVKVYDDKGKHLATMGKEGQGPGDIRGPHGICITPQNEVMVPDSLNNRLTFFSAEGKFIRSITTTPFELLETKIDSTGYVIGREVVRDEENSRWELKKFDSRLNYLFSLDSSPIPDLNKMNPFLPPLSWDIDKNDRIISGYPEKYEINIFNPEGTLIKRIQKDYEPLEIAEEQLERLKDIPPQIKLDVPQHHVAYWSFFVDDECRIFAFTWEKAPGQDKRYFDVFDSEGKYIAKIPLMQRTQVIKKNKLYAIEEDKMGYHVIKRYRVTWKI